jgi:histone-lysine N-methyltransferase SUV420H
MAQPRSVLEGSKGLTHRIFSEFDDIATELLVDRAHQEVPAYARPTWDPPDQVRKMSPSFHRIHDTPLNDVREVISLLSSREYDINSGLHALLKVPFLRDYVDVLPELLKSNFVYHICRYLKVHLPDCPFDISATARYTGVMEDTRLIARKEVMRGAQIKYLNGKLVSITADEEESLATQGLDFSIFASDLTGLSILLGPARFPNHDCKSNARFVTAPRSREVHVVAKRNILPGEEITIDYGDEYFGPDNTDCLCHTCETRRQEREEYSRSGGYEFRRIRKGRP